MATHYNDLDLHEGSDNQSSDLWNTIKNNRFCMSFALVAATSTLSLVTSFIYAVLANNPNAQPVADAPLYVGISAGLIVGKLYNDALSEQRTIRPIQKISTALFCFAAAIGASVSQNTIDNDIIIAQEATKVRPREACQYAIGKKDDRPFLLKIGKKDVVCNKPKYRLTQSMRAQFNTKQLDLPALCASQSATYVRFGNRNPMPCPQRLTANLGR